MRPIRKPNATDQSDKLGQMNNAEFNLEHIAKAGFDILERAMKEKVLEPSSLENLPQTQRHRRKSRAECKIAALERAHGDKRSSPQQSSVNQTFSLMTPIDIPNSIDVGDAAASPIQTQKLPPNNQAQPTTHPQPTPQLQPDPPPPPFSVSLLATCHNCTTSFPATPYNLPTSCPTCQHPLVYQPFTEEKKAPPVSKTSSPFHHHLPLHQRAEDQATLEEANAAGEVEQQGGQRVKRRWTMDEKRVAEAARRGSGGETGVEEAAAVRVKKEATEDKDEDDTVFGKEVHVQQQHQTHKTRKEKKKEWAENHQDTLTPRSSLNSKARRHIRRTLAVIGRDLESRRDENDVVFMKEEVHVQHKSRKEKKKEWAEDHRDTLPERCSGLNSKARRHVRRMLAATGREFESRR